MGLLAHFFFKDAALVDISNGIHTESAVHTKRKTLIFPVMKRCDGFDPPVLTHPL